MNNTVKHIPVLLNEVLEALTPQAGKTYVDATFGNGGYSEAVLKAADCRLIAVDRDPNVRPRAEELKSVYGSRFDFRPGRFGEERKSRQIAAKIVEARKTAPVATTRQLAEIIYQVIFKKTGQPDPATRTFQALRIAVNDELGELERGLAGGLSALKPGGRLAVVTFHSLEDRIVKNFFKQKAGKNEGVSRYLPEAATAAPAELAFCSKAVPPTAAEVEANPRAHSAKLRYAIKSDKETGQ